MEGMDGRMEQIRWWINYRRRVNRRKSMKKGIETNEGLNQWMNKWVKVSERTNEWMEGEGINDGKKKGKNRRMA